MRVKEEEQNKGNWTGREKLCKGERKVNERRRETDGNNMMNEKQ